ncbi:MAG: hypothetical protein IJR90_01345 [Clostridia bacterium]|nr:hypothetical protein [Clostridia bacterium]
MKFKRAAALFAAAILLFSGCGTRGNGGGDTSEPETTARDMSKYDPREAVSLKSEHFSVTNDKLAYFFYKDYYDAVNLYYESYFAPYGLDPTKDLKEQNYDNTATWFDYFMGVTVQNVLNYLRLAEAAIDRGAGLDDADRAKAAAELDDIKAAAEEFGMSLQEFLDSRFGEGLTEESLRECLELYYLSDKQFSYISDSVAADDASLEAYYEENKKDFLFVDFRKVEVRADQTEYANEEARKAGFAEAERQSRYIEASAGIDEYVERGIAYYKSINDTLEVPLSDEEIYTKVTNIVVQYGFNDTTAFGKWAFADGRRAGDIVMLDNGSGIYTVYYLVTPPYRAENKTVNYRYSCFTDEEKAKAALAEFESGERSGERFADLVSGADGAQGNGSLRENVDLGETAPAVEVWLFDKERRQGDCGLAEQDGYYYLLYYEGDGKISWKLSAENAIRSGVINTELAKYAAKYKIESDKDNIYLIPGENAYTRAVKE